MIDVPQDDSASLGTLGMQGLDRSTIQLRSEDHVGTVSRILPDNAIVKTHEN
jgi:hypothetical protein